MRWESKSHESSFSISLFRTAIKILLAFISRAAWQHRYWLHYESRLSLKNRCSGRSRSLILHFSSAKDVCTVSFLVRIFVFETTREVFLFSEDGLRDRDIIFRDQIDLVFCFLGCVVKFPAREANIWRRRASSNPGNWVWLCLFSLFFAFLPF